MDRGITGARECGSGSNRGPECPLGNAEGLQIAETEGTVPTLARLCRRGRASGNRGDTRPQGKEHSCPPFSRASESGLSIGPAQDDSRDIIMKHSTCEFDELVLQALRTNHWDSTLEGHVHQCGICSDLLAVAGGMRQLGELPVVDSRIPDPRQIWYKAQ